MGGVVDAIGDVVGGVADAVGDVVGGVVDVVSDVVESVADVVGDVVEGVGDVVGDVWEFVEENPAVALVAVGGLYYAGAFTSTAAAGTSVSAGSATYAGIGGTQGAMLAAQTAEFGAIGEAMTMVSAGVAESTALASVGLGEFTSVGDYLASEGITEAAVASAENTIASADLVGGDSFITNLPGSGFETFNYAGITGEQAVMLAEQTAEFGALGEAATAVSAGMAEAEALAMVGLGDYSTIDAAFEASNVAGEFTSSNTFMRHMKNILNVGSDVMDSIGGLGQALLGGAGVVARQVAAEKIGDLVQEQAGIRRKANAMSQGLAEHAANRGRISLAEEAQRKRADLIAGGFAAGVVGASAVAGSTSAVMSDLGRELGYSTAVQGANKQISIFNQDIADINVEIADIEAQLRAVESVSNIFGTNPIEGIGNIIETGGSIFDMATDFGGDLIDAGGDVWDWASNLF